MNSRSVRILHTSDWHVGRTNNRISRREDVEYALEQIKEKIKSEKVDVLVVCGDIFDKPQVANQDAELVWNFFLEVNSMGVISILLSGNHDSQDFLRSVKPLLKLARTYIYDKMVPSTEILQRSILMWDEKQKICFFAIPYPHPSHISKITDDIHTRAMKYSDGISRYLEEGVNKILQKYGKDTKIIVLSHLFISEAKPSGTEREISLLSQFSVSWKSLPKNVIYYGLGHIHRMQEIENPDTIIYYPGSIFQIDFSEEGDKKYCILIEIPEEGNPKVYQDIPIHIKRELKTFEYNADKEDQNQFLQKLRDEKNKNTLKRVIIKGAKIPRPEFIEEINRCEGVVSVSVQGKQTGSADLPKDINPNSDLITLYEKYYLEYKKGKKESFDVIKSRFIEIFEELRKIEEQA